MHPVLIIGGRDQTPSDSARPLAVRWLGTVPYSEAVLLQEDLVRSRQQGLSPDTLLLLEHRPVVTLGRSADPAHLRLPEDELRRQGVEIFEAARGGDVTFHGPGHLVGYPILLLPPPLRDLHGLLRRVEAALIAVAADFGIEARREPGLTGVWVGDAKLAAIGMRVSRWVTSHGFALNVSDDLKGFDLIVPCGIHGRGVTSLSRLLGRPVSLQEVIPSVASHFSRAFDLQAAEVQHVGA